MSKLLGTFVWYDAMTSDAEAAQSFYRSVMGWNLQDFGANDYTVLSVGNHGIGGIMPIPEEAAARGMKPSWRGYIAVDDVDVYAARVQAAGGTVLYGPENIPDVGRFASVADLHGAVFILFRALSGQEPVPVKEGTPGHIGWRELHAGDRESAFTFYSGLFSWTKVRTADMGPMGVYQTFAAGGVESGGMMTKIPEIPAPFWLYYFNVDDIDAAAKRVEKAGGRISMGPHQVPTGNWILQCFDPQGAMFALVGPRH